MDKIKVISGSKGKDYNLISYFKLTDIDEKFIIYNDLKNITDLYFAKIKIEKDSIKLVKPTEKEMGLIDRMFLNSRSIRHRRMPVSELGYLVFHDAVLRSVDRKEYNEIVESPVVKKQVKDSKLTQIRKEKEELKKELVVLKDTKKEKLDKIGVKEEQMVDVEDATWEHVKEESRYITDDELLHNIEKEITELELEEFHERCRLNIIKVIAMNIISLFLVGVFLYGMSYINDVVSLFGNPPVFNNAYFDNILKMYGTTSLVTLVLQFTSLWTHKNFFSKISMFAVSVMFLYTFTQMVNGYMYSFGIVTIFITAIVNIIINFGVYLQLQLKLM